MGSFPTAWLPADAINGLHHPRGDRYIDLFLSANGTTLFHGSSVAMKMLPRSLTAHSDENTILITVMNGTHRPLEHQRRARTVTACCVDFIVLPFRRRGVAISRTHEDHRINSRCWSGLVGGPTVLLRSYADDIVVYAKDRTSFLPRRLAIDMPIDGSCVICIV